MNNNEELNKIAQQAVNEMMENRAPGQPGMPSTTTTRINPLVNKKEVLSQLPPDVLKTLGEMAQ